MKRIFLSFAALVLVSLSYGQAVEMVKVIPTNPAAVVDELRVYGTGNTDVSSIQSMNVGLPLDEGANKPFQTQSLKVNQLNVASVYAERDLFVNNPAIKFQNISVGDNNSVYTKISIFPVLQAGLLRTKTITGPSAANNLELLDNNDTKVSGGNITVDSAVITSPFKKGNEILKKNIYLFGQALTGDNEAKQAKQHIYQTWSEISDSSTTAPTVTPRCNANNRLCSVTKCDACDNASNSFCYDVRSKTLPAVYNAKGATYTKVGTIRLYCRPNDTFAETESLQIRLQNSTCEQYMIYASKNGGYMEGFTTGSNASITTNPLSNILISNDLANVSKDVGEKCYIKCGSVTGCTSSQAGESLILVDGNGVSVAFSDFANSNFCANAKYGPDDTPRWSEGSGLSCRANEKTFDVYALRCHQGSGTRLRAANTYYQQRKVICKQYSHVRAEFSDAYDSLSTYYAKDFFYPSFVISLNNLYGDLTAVQAIREMSFSNQNSVQAH
jgi:hypothetical protein